MEEAFLHYLWKHRKFGFTKAETTKGEEITIISVGEHNHNSGPDFFNSKIKIGSQVWAGNVEIHVNSSLWYTHAHQEDAAYNNVILHVVWEHDKEVLRRDQTEIPVLELKNLVSGTALEKYKELFAERSLKWINCENNFGAFGDFELNNWLDRLYLERLEEKSAVIFGHLQKSDNNWEEVLFKMLARNFGLNVNGEALESVANSFPFPVLRKTAGNITSLEALIFGQAGMLEDDIEDEYFLKLKKEFAYLKHKFKLTASGVTPVKYFRLRPDNFPTIRLAQLAALYASEEKLFSKIISASTRVEILSIFNIKTSAFWKNHYTFSKESKLKEKQLSKKFVDLLIINTLIPIKFCFAKQQGKEAEEGVFQLISSLKAEENSVTKKFNKLREKTAVNALQSQALLQMKTQFCDKNNCLNCNLATGLLR